MDNIAEQLVAKKRTTADNLKTAGIIIGALVIASLLMFVGMVTNMFFLAVPAGLVLMGGIWLMGNVNVEYEYIVTNNELDIDKIIGKNKRKRMITLDISSAVLFEPIAGCTEEIDADVTVHATTGLEKDAYYLVIDSKDYGKVNLIFNPNEKMRGAIAQELPHKLRVKL